MQHTPGASSGSGEGGTQEASLVRISSKKRKAPITIDELETEMLSDEAMIDSL